MEVAVVAELFRFASIRPPQLRGTEGDDVLALYGPNESTPFRDKLVHLGNEGAPRTSFVVLAERYLATSAVQNII